jgi:hypothetical protein
MGQPVAPVIAVGAPRGAAPAGGAARSIVRHAAVGPAAALIADPGSPHVAITAIAVPAIARTAGMAPRPLINVSLGARQGTANVAAAAAVVARTGTVSVDDLSG